MAAITSVSLTHMVQNPQLDKQNGNKRDHFVAGDYGITLDLTGDVLTITGPGGTTLVPRERIVEYTS